MFRALLLFTAIWVGTVSSGCAHEARSPAQHAQASAVSAPVPEQKARREVEQVPPSTLPDAAIIALLIQASLADYPGNCACPYHRDRADRACGARSAHSRPKGRSPLCYPSDVTPAMIDAERKKHRAGK